MIWLAFTGCLMSALLATASPQPCELTINKRAYRPDKNLYTHKQYEILFGVAPDAANPPIGYSIDVDCRNLSKLRVAYAFDIKDASVEINSVNCTKTINYIHVLEPSPWNSSNTSHLNVLVDLRNLKLPASANLRLSVNRRLGKGCSSVLTFVKHDGSNSIFDHDYYDGTSMWSKLRELFLSYGRLLTSPLVILTTLAGLALVLMLAVLLLVCMRRQSFRMSELKLNPTLVSLKNITRRCHNQSANRRRFDVLKSTRRVDEIEQPVLASSELREDDSKCSAAPPPPPFAPSCPSLVELVDPSNPNEFQVLREQLINKTS